MREIKKIFMFLVLCFAVITSIGAVSLPADAFIDTYQVQVDVNLHSIEYFSKATNTTDEELLKYHNAIIDIAKEHCSEKEIGKINKLFDEFLTDRTENSLQLYTDTVTKLIKGNPNYTLFFVVIVIVIGGITISIRKIK